MHVIQKSPRGLIFSTWALLHNVEGYYAKLWQVVWWWVKSPLIGHCVAFDGYRRWASHAKESADGG